MSTRTITLTGRPPVAIDEDDWTVIAEAKDESHDGQVRCQANRVSSWSVRVRQSDSDARVIVSAVYSYATNWQGARSLGHKRGIMIQPRNAPWIADESRYVEPDDQSAHVAAICAAIEEVCGQMAGGEHASGDGERWTALAHECIADLPAEVI